MPWTPQDYRTRRALGWLLTALLVALLAVFIVIASMAISGCTQSNPQAPVLGETRQSLEERWDLRPDDLDLRRNWQRYSVWDWAGQRYYYVTTVNDTVVQVQLKRFN